MHFRFLPVALVLLLTLFFPACSGGTSSTTAGARSCGDGSTELFCLTSCNLGCSLSGCSINSVAQNEPIELIFNTEINKFSVPPYKSSILLRTANGEEPVGDWLVNGNRLTFVPRVQIIGAQTFFGFRPNQTYTLYIPAGDDQLDVIESQSGQRISSTITCTLNIGEIKDLNQATPSARLITPRNTSGSELDTRIVIEFNEIIDPSVFIGTDISTRPIRFSVKKAEIINGEVVCRPESASTALPGDPLVTIDPVRSISIVSFTPKADLPGKRCVEVEVTSAVKDLAGVAAIPHVMRFTTKDVGVQIGSNVEDFTNSRYLDTSLSAGSWGGGALTFNPVGGSGKHGVFNPAYGKVIATGAVTVYEWDLDAGITIPKSQTKSQQTEVITDGRFEFSRMEVPDGTEVRFVGSIPARIWVRGECRIGGKLSASGESISPNGRPGWGGKNATTGETGGRGGCMGGVGGNGGDRGDGVARTPAFDGKDGQDVQLRDAMHFYATRFVGTGGKGSPQFPLTGRSADVTFTFSNVISQMANRGGGGGGFTSPGGVGEAKWPINPSLEVNLASGTTPGGSSGAFPPTFPNYTNGYTPADHFLVGGSGGGGSGSSVGGAVQSTPSSTWWLIGRAGQGGGGALGLRCGLLTVLGTGSLEANGGDGAQDSAGFSLRGMMAPGGAGSGGSLFLQVAGATSNDGVISARGGVAGLTQGTASDPVYSGMQSRAGAGSDGLIHFETVNTAGYDVGTTIPASPSVAAIRNDDQDPLVTVRSLWYEASLTLPPTFSRYEIEAEVDGQPVVFSDDPSKGVLADVGQPLRFEIQGAKLEIDPSGRLAPIANTKITPLLKYVGPFGGPNEPALSDDNSTGYRFELSLDRSLGKTVVVKKITIFWEI